MAEAYLEKLFSKLKTDIKPAVRLLFSSIPSKILKKVKVLKSHKNLEDLIQKNFKKLDMADVDSNLRKARLREAKRAKRELEGKLLHLTESIDNLNQLKDSIKVKPSLMDSNVRHEYFEEEKQKSKKVQMKSREYYEEQKRRQAKMQKHLQDLQKEIEYEREQKEKEAQAQEDKRKRDYEENLKKIKEKAGKRKRELEESRSCVQSERRLDKPLYVKISEKFWKSIEMPELEKRKAELIKKREMKNSYSSHHIIQHAKWYETIKKDHQQKLEKELHTQSIDRKVRSSDNTITLWQQRLKAEEKHQKQQRQKEHEEMLKKLDKRMQYANLVKEMYPPSVNKAKNLEVENRKLKFSESEKNLERKPASVINERPDWKPHKFKPNKMIPEKKEVKKGEKIDYLKVIREGREKGEEEGKERIGEQGFKADFQEIESLPEEQKVKALQKLTQKLEKEIRKKEIVSGNSPLNLKATDEINEMLINSIKAKLSVIEKTKS